MKRRLLRAVLVSAAIWPCHALACGGPAGSTIALSTDGIKYTVTNLGRAFVHVTFTAWGQTFELKLAPGQSGTAIGSGMFGQFMRGYETCYAVEI